LGENDGNRRTHTEHNFGSVYEDCSPNPSRMAVAAMTRILGQGRFVADLSPNPEKLSVYLPGAGKGDYPYVGI
jgi:hypothetical protein